MDRPNNFQLLRVLQTMFRAQAADIARRLTLDHVDAAQAPDTTHWTQAIAAATKPLLLQSWQQGMVRSRQRVAALLRQREGKPAYQEPHRRREIPTVDIFNAKGVMSSDERSRNRLYLPAVSAVSLSVAKASYSFSRGSWPDRVPPALRKAAGNVGVSFDLFQPKVLDAVDAATLHFCRETNATATVSLTEALRRLRKLLKEGLLRGDAVAYLARKVREIYADPMRAFRIATTETSRAMHGGALMAAQANPAVAGKEWLASSDACERCLELNGLQKRLDEPFYVDSAGGVYAVVMYPPLHPHCLLPETSVLAPGAVGAMKALFTGTCYRITFANGDQVACTPNHMLLTRHGFLCAKDLVEGDNVLYRRLGKGPRVGDPDDNGGPSRIEKVFNTWTIAGGLPTVCVMPSPEYLHGDAAGCQGDIYVVGAYGLLGDVLDRRPTLQEPSQKAALQYGQFPLGLYRGRESDLGGLLHRLAALCPVGGLRHESACLLAQDRVGVGVLAGSYAGFLEGPQNCSALTAEALGQGGSSFSPQVSGCDFLDLDGIELLPIWHVEPFSYSGPVYDLTTSSSLYYISSGVVSSNCFCDFTEVLHLQMAA